MFRSPVAKRVPSSGPCPVRAASKRQIPARTSSSGHGSCPGDPSVRLSSWQALEREPWFT